MAGFEVSGDFRPVGLQPLTTEEQQAPTREQSFFNILTDSYALGWLGQIKDGIDTFAARARYSGRVDPSYDPLTNIPSGYEQWADDFAWATTPDEILQIRQNIDENQEIRRRRDQAGWGWVLGADLVAGVFDPTNLIPVPALKGIGFVKGALLGGAAMGTINAGTEAVRHSLDPTSTLEETAFNIGMGYAVGGLLSGGIGHFTRGHSGPADLSPDLQMKSEELGQKFADASNAVDGLTEAEVRSIIEKSGDTKIVFGAGKTNADGRYVPAFFRPKEAFEATARREEIGRAIDSALGDVVPDGDVAIEEISDVVDRGNFVSETFIKYNNGKQLTLNTAGTSRVVDESRVNIDPGYYHPNGIVVDETFIKYNIGNLRDESTSDILARVIDQALAKGAIIRIKNEQGLGFGVDDVGIDQIVGPGLKGASGREYKASDLINKNRDVSNPRIEIVTDKDTVVSLDGADLAKPAQVKKELASPEAKKDLGDVAGETEDTIFVDDAYIMGQFDQKPWTSPKVPGVQAFPEDAFASPHEWLLFNVLHERNHVRTKRLPTETKAEYETRINTMAYDELQAARATLAPTRRTKLEALSIYPLPSAKLARLAPDSRDVHDIANGIAGDMDTMKVANELLGPTTPGGSVFMLAQRKLIVNYEFGVAWRKSYVEYITGASSTSRFANASNALKAARYGAPLIGKAAREGRLSPREFREYVSRAIDMDGEPFELHGKPLSDADMKLVERAAREHDRIMESFAKEAQEIGLFDYQQRVQREIEWRERHNQRDADRLENLREGSPLRTIIQDQIDVRSTELDDLRVRAEELQANPVMPKGENRYRPRMYNIQKIRDNYDAFVALIEKAFIADGNVNAGASAKGWVDNLIGNGGIDLREIGDIGRPNSLKSRVIPLTNKELAGYLVDDASLVLGIYSRRMSSAIEMFKKYGSLNLNEQFSDLQAKLQDQGYKPKEIQEIIENLGDQRERVLGSFVRKDPLSWDSRVTRNVKNWVNLTLMGRGLFSQTTDIGRTVALNGFEPFFKAMGKAIDMEFEDIGRGTYAKQAGEAMELVNNQLAMQAMEHEDALMITTQTRMERGLSGAAQLMYTANLMNPFTVVWKNLTSLMSAHSLLDQAITVSKAIDAGRTMSTLTKAELKQAQYLASFGINPRDAQLLASMPYERSGTNGLILANLENWSGKDGERARELFLGALQGTIRSSVITPGPLQRPAWMDGVFRIGGKRIEQPLLSLPFNLMGFIMSSSAKLTHSMLSGRDRQMAVTMGALFISGYIGARLRAGENWDRMDWMERSSKALDASGVFGWLGEVYRRTEDLTGVVSETTGMTDLGENTVSDEIGAVAGPGASLIAGVIEAFTNPDIEDRQRAYLIRRTIPFNNLIWFNSYMKELSNWAADAGMVSTVDSYDESLEDEAMGVEQAAIE